MPRRAERRRTAPGVRRTPGVPGCLAAAIGCLLLLLPHEGAANAKRKPAAQPVGTSPRVVDVGIWPTIVYNLDIGANSFYLAAYVWFVWDADFDTDPSATVEFTNNVESWGLTRRKTYPEPILLPDGRRYQCIRIEGRFFHPFNLGRFPLEEHRLVLSIEDDTFPATDLVYRFDAKNSGLDPGLEIPGWEIYDRKATVSERLLGTNLGDPTIGGDVTFFSHVDFEIHVRRPAKFFYWKMLLPATIVMLATWMGLLLHPEEQAARAAMVGTALLSAVFLQQSYTQSLPETNHLVLMDRIYVLVYGLLVVSLVHVVLQGIRVKTGADHATVGRHDRTSVAIQALLFTIGLWWLIRTTP